MRYPDAPAAYCYHSPLFKRLVVTLDYRANQFDSLGHSNIGQEYQPRMGDPSQVDQLSEVLVHCDEDTVICSRLFQ